jgi:hypothetical protein
MGESRADRSTCLHRSRPRARAALGLGVLTAAFLVSGAPGGATAPVRTAAGPGYVSVLFGRSQNGVVDSNCQQLPGSVTIPTALAEFKRRGWIGTGVVVVSSTTPSTDTCTQGTVYPSWATMRGWRDQYGFEVVSEGNYIDVKTQTPQQVKAQSCDLLPTFVQQGFSRAWGMWAYPANISTPAIQTQIIDTCFAYGRKYVSRVNKLPIPAPYFQDTQQIRGGNCNLPNLPCSSIYHWGNPYEDPAQISAEVQVHGGQWMAIQVYRLVAGAGAAWDCTSADWRAHWTTQHETYCWNDLLAALQTMPAGTVVTDPATVAQGNGQVPPH